MSTLRFAREDVRQVDLDVGDGYCGERIAHGKAGVRIRAGVDNDSVGIPPQALYRVDESALMEISTPSSRAIERNRDSISASVVVP
jgi:hypothetical protein